MPYLGRTVVTNLADFHVDNYASGGGFTAGSTTQLTLTVAGIDDEEALSIFFDGVHQAHDSWVISNSVVTFDSAIPSGVAAVEIHYGKQPVASALAANSIDSEHYVDGSIDLSHIAANQIDETKIKDAFVADFTEITAVAGDSILIGDASDSGNSKRDTIQGILDLAGGGGTVWLARATLAGAATYDFESVLSSSYDSYLFIFNGVHISGANSFGARVSTDNGSTYYSSSGNYHSHTLGGDSAASTDNRNATETSTRIPLADTQLRGLDTDAAHALGGTFQLFEVNSTVHNKFMIYQSGHYDNEGDCAMTMGSCMLNATVNIDAVQFLSDTGTLDEGTIDCYAYAKS